ncbi:dihydrofolate reductase family protein [Demequina aurantiaca]|uniref:dihydrofolate reductase family protein n=1 Tax=Demequina aurantiaca TaxID=676200 RepID=UPI003D328FDD
MGDLYYIANMSLDGYTTDAKGNFDFTEPDAEVHQFFNALERGFGVSLLGRRMYETMVCWETNPADASESAIAQEFAEIWRSQRKIVYSTTLDAVSSQRTSIERVFDPAAVRAMVRESPTDVSIGGPTLASAALRARIVDYVYVLVVPELVGGGLAAFPEGVCASLQAMERRQFANGTVAMLYGVVSKRRLSTGP